LTMTTTPLAASSYPAWVFDDSPLPDPHGKGERAVQFLKALRHPKSVLPGRSFQLDRWQERIIRKIYGDTKPDGTRRIKTAMMLLPRGARKTTLGAAMCLLALGPERVPGSQVVSAAVDRDQARIALEEMKGIIGAHPKFEAAFQVQDTKNRITHRKTSAFYRAMSADAATAHGRTPVFALVDELHAWKRTRPVGRHQNRPCENPRLALGGDDHGRHRQRKCRLRHVFLRAAGGDRRYR